MAESVLALPGQVAAKVLKWKVKSGTRISQSMVLGTYQPLGSDKTVKLKSVQVGSVLEVVVPEGETAQPGAALLKLQGCSHPIVMKDMCAECGADLRHELGRPGDRKENISASVAMVHSVPELIVSEEQALELGMADEQLLVSSRKLVLLVDLDQTLIHTTNDNIPNNLKDVFHFQLRHGRSSMWYHTKFRPGTKKFLEKISTLFELHICTFGVRLYAHTIAGFLDPETKYFSHRILSRDECFNPQSKTANLKALFPRGDSMVAIIDDRDDVWRFAPNLVHVKPYIFFEGTADINAPPEMTKTALTVGAPKHRAKIVKVPVKKQSKETPASDSEESLHKMEVDDQSTKTEESKDTLDVKDDNKDNTEDTSTKTSEECKSPSDPSESDSNLLESNAMETNQSEHTKIEVSQSQAPKANTEKVSDKAVSDDHLSVQPESSVIEGSRTNSESKQERTEKTQGDILSADSTESSTNGLKDKNEEEEFEEMVEWSDDDDYLCYLEEILTRIHTAYYECYDQVKKVGGDMPDLKNIIPYVKRKVLKGANIVFSGVIPTNAPPEKSRAYVVAKALGANVHSTFIPKDGESDSTKATTHVVAARSGTAKVNMAQKCKKVVHIVNPNWLWCCSDRWEWVDERVFPLVDDGYVRDSPDVKQMKSRGSKKRKMADADIDSIPKYDPITGKRIGKKHKPKTGIDESSESCSSKANEMAMDDDYRDIEEFREREAISQRQRRFSDDINPLYSFSKDDIDNMDKEVEEILEESDSENSDSETELRKKVLGKKVDNSSSEESLTGDYPRGWKIKKRRSISPQDEEEEEEGEIRDSEDLTPPENPNRIFQFSDQSSDSSDSDKDKDSIGSVDEEMAAAVEKEFLSF